MSRKSLFLIGWIGILLSLFAFNTASDARPFLGRTHQLQTQTVAPGTGNLVLDFTVPHDHEFAYEAPSTVWIRFKNPDVFKTTVVEKTPKSLDLAHLPYTTAFSATKGKTVVVMDIRAHFCDKETQICLTDSMRIKFPLEVKEGAPKDLSFKIPLRSKFVS